MTGAPPDDLRIASTPLERELWTRVRDALRPGEDEVLSGHDIQLDAPPAYAFLETDRESRYLTVYGGRDAAKSWQVARVLLKRAATQRHRVLCARQFQSSIKDSVHKLLGDQIDLMGLSAMFEVTNAEIRCPRTGSGFVFKGLRRNIRDIKGLEGITLVWVEEAEAVSYDSWRLLLGTIKKQGSQIFVSYNPYEDTDPTHRMFAVKPEDLDGPANIRRVSYRDNPYLSETSRRRIETIRRTDPDMAAHEYDGECLTRTDAQILGGKWKVDTFEPEAGWHGPYFGLDFGSSVSPTAMVECYVDEARRRLLVRRESGGKGVEITEIRRDVFGEVPLSLTHRVRADNARPETISHLVKQDDLDVVAVEKWPGSVEDGIAHMRGYGEIVIHPSCTNTIRECRWYRRKVDALTGDVLRQIIDKHNHWIDAVRYALQPIIKAEPPKKKVRATWGR